MSDFGNRPAELITALERLKELTEDQRPVLTVDEHTALHWGLTHYFSARKTALDDLLKLLDDIDSEAAKDPDWERRVKAAIDDLNRTVGDALNNITVPTVAAAGFRAVTLRDERRFWDGLNEVAAAQIRDAMIVKRKGLENLASEAETRWNDLKARHAGLAQAEQAAADVARKQVDEVAETVVGERWRKMGEQMATLAQLVLDPAEKLTENRSIDVKIMAAFAQQALAQCIGIDNDHVNQQVDGMKKLATQWLEKLKVYKAKVDEFREVMLKEPGRVHVLFTQTYQDTRKFLMDPDFDHIMQLHRNAGDDLSRWASTLSGPAREDADQFAKDVLERLAKNQSSTEAVLDRFTAANRGRFIAPLAPNTVEELTATQAWENWVYGVKSQDLDGKLRQARADLDNCFNIDIDGPLAHTRETIQNLEGITGTQRQELLKMHDAHAEHLRTQLLGAIKDLANVARESAQAMSAQSIEQNFLRTEFPDKLKSGL